MHFAALSQVGEAMREPGKYWRGNVCASLNLIEATVAAGVRDFVFSSTCATYGDHDGVVLDEAQNATSMQMKMFLTRLGFGARMVVTGDTSQVDLPRGTQSGLAQAVEVLEGIEGLEMVRFDSSDVVRHSLVSAIVDAYDAARGPAERSQKRGGARRGR